MSKLDALPTDMKKYIIGKLDDPADILILRALYPNLSNQIELPERDSRLLSQFQSDQVILEQEAIDFLPVTKNEKKLLKNVPYKDGTFVVPADLFDTLVDHIIEKKGLPNVYDAISGNEDPFISKRLNIDDQGYIYSNKHKKYVSIMTLNTNNIKYILGDRLPVSRGTYHVYSDMELAFLLRMYRKY